uniref:Uncharacterized protein n=1 Tax=Timema genevievae TaxID=629358 RepID=A0A7R9K0C0_TIMGE|nr:unnamed protein product [Timema genevievae]
MLSIALTPMSTNLMGSGGKQKERTLALVETKKAKKKKQRDKSMEPQGTSELVEDRDPGCKEVQKRVRKKQLKKQRASLTVLHNALMNFDFSVTYLRTNERSIGSVSMIDDPLNPI